MTGSSSRATNITVIAIPPKRGVAYPRLGVCMVPFYIIYSITIDRTFGGHGLAP